ncbi:hypothetical protein, partial [Escherichia coli]|uniref:hypothetical protein n=1 Tax=Escherichia coli TaxID=562 RepID=UPI001BE4470B
MNYSCALMPDATLSRLIRPTIESQSIEFAHFVGRIRRSRRIRHSVPVPHPALNIHGNSGGNH